MVIGIYRIFSLFTRVFARPITNYLKGIHLYNFRETTGFNKAFVHIGVLASRVEYWLNLKIMNLKTDTEMFKIPIAPEIALRKGVSVFYDLLFYSVVLIVCGYEVIKIYYVRDEKRRKDEEMLEDIHNKLNATQERFRRERMIQEITFNRRSNYISTMNSRLKSMIRDTSQMYNSDSHYLSLENKLNDQYYLVNEKMRPFTSN